MQEKTLVGWFNWLLRVTNSSAFAAVMSTLVVLATVCAICALPNEQRTVQTIGSIIQTASVVLGLFSLVLIARQIRTTATQTATQVKWSRSLSYHQFFGDLVTAEVRDKIISVAEDCNFVEQHKKIEPMSKQSVDLIMKQSCNESVISAYLDEFEEFCGAIHAGLLDEDYAYCLESTRVIKVWVVFSPYIEDSRSRTNFRTYLELEKIANKWSARRDEEDRASAVQTAAVTRQRTIVSGVKQALVD